MDNIGEKVIILPVTAYPLASKVSHPLQVQNKLIHPKLLKFSTHYIVNSKLKSYLNFISSTVPSKLSKLSICEALNKINPEENYFPPVSL